MAETFSLGENNNKFMTSAGDEFHWRQPSAATRRYELLRHDSPFGKLEFRSLLGTLAWSQDPIQPWSFKRVGFLNMHITIRMPDADSDYALFDPKFIGGGTLHMPDGRPFIWEPINLWHTRWQFTDRNSHPVLQFEEGAEDHKLSDLFKLQARMVVASGRMTNLDFSILANLGFYLMVLHRMDIAAASAGASSA
jgi:hypothetical protein